MLKTFKIVYGKGKPAPQEQIINVPKYRDAVEFAAANAHGWGFDIFPVKKYLISTLEGDFHCDDWACVALKDPDDPFGDRLQKVVVFYDEEGRLRSMLEASINVIKEES